MQDIMNIYKQFLVYFQNNTRFLFFQLIYNHACWLELILDETKISSHCAPIETSLALYARALKINSYTFAHSVKARMMTWYKDVTSQLGSSCDIISDKAHCARHSPFHYY